MNRRNFLTAIASATASKALALPQKRRVAVIGHTGRGNYGHSLDVAWQKIENCQIVGVADASESGLQEALKRLDLSHGFSQYTEMLKALRPEFVSITPRHADQHREMMLAAIHSGARGIYVEKPFCRSPAEADEVLKAARQYGVKIAVAHRNRYHPALFQIDQLLANHSIGRLLELRGHGLGDRRGGGEDLWVLGCHVLNLFHYFAGEPRSCSGILLQDGEPLTRKDIRPGAEGLGSLGANEIHARWHMQSGLIAHYTTFAEDGSDKRGYAAHIIGTKGTISIQIDRDPVAWLSPGNPFDPASRNTPRIPITSSGLGQKETHHDLIAKVHNHALAIEDLILAVDEDRAPMCDGNQGAMTVEMICSVFESHLQGGTHVAFPLQQRDNPLDKL